MCVCVRVCTCVYVCIYGCMYVHAHVHTEIVLKAAGLRLTIIYSTNSGSQLHQVTLMILGKCFIETKPGSFTGISSVVALCCDTRVELL